MVKHLILQERYKDSKDKRLNKASFRITIPKAIVLALGWKKGDIISFVCDGRKIILNKSPKKILGKIRRNIKDANESFLGYD